MIRTPCLPAGACERGADLRGLNDGRRIALDVSMQIRHAGRSRFGFLLVAGALVVAACAPKALNPDAGSTGTGGMYICNHPTYVTSCSPGVLVTSDPSGLGSTCSVEGAHCEGTQCIDSHGEGPWEVTCCGGQWLAGYRGTCPGTGGMGGAGGSGTSGGGTIGAGGQGAMGRGGVTGTGGFDTCVHQPISDCTPDGVTGPAGPDDRSACDAEGAICQGTFCYDMHGEGSFVSTCCAGKWWPGYAGSCATVLQPGDPFDCGNSPPCAAYQTYCSIKSMDSGFSHTLSCQPICAAGDCSCFCNNPDGCDFAPPDSTCPADRCMCGMTKGGPGVAMPGAVVVQCNYIAPNIGDCIRNTDLDTQCAGGTGWVCVGPAKDRVGCTALPDFATNASCAGEVHEYCCANN